MDGETKTEGGKAKKMNHWFLSTVLLIVVLAVFITFFFMSSTAMVTGISSEEAANNAVDYINSLPQYQGAVSLVSVSELGLYNLYNLKISIQGQVFDSYVTKDGKLLFPSAIDITETPETTTTTVPQEIAKTERPEANLFVMSFCPYGVQAENLMKPVVDLLGDKADIKIRFIARVQGDTVDSVQSLHGIDEAKEDLRQVCIMKYYDQKTFWDYLMEINENCYPLWRDADKLDTCWKEAAQKFGIDTDKIENCAYGSEGLDLLKADEQLANQYSVTGSPTLIINGQRYGGARTSDAFKQGICSGFITEPSECSQTLGGSSSTPSGQC